LLCGIALDRGFLVVEILIFQTQHPGASRHSSWRGVG
jgi:hypothetical protein